MNTQSADIYGTFADKLQDHSHIIDHPTGIKYIVCITTQAHSAAYIFYDGPQPIGESESMRLESVEPVFETDSGLRGCGPRCRHRGAVVQQFFGILLPPSCNRDRPAYKADKLPDPPQADSNGPEIAIPV